MRPVRAGAAACAVLLLAGCYARPPGYGLYPVVPQSFGPGAAPPYGPPAAPPYGPGGPVFQGPNGASYVPSGNRPGCMEYHAPGAAGDTAAPLVCPAPDGSLRVVTGEPDTP